ncbi:TetR/AcrR family transcriptional regulator [Actinomyces howellii]|uniref:Putative DNA-binding transcriptional regulator n=1 Tax=Actinomyces howellii TaxID=52771 RepID=A0A448HE69_9ACTO|nr:TetR family transcriptional regulator [Actinomyces howellii]VEG26053.1 putative DNA-binding transcriptional regulator [Actinomyces howellii]
MAETLAPEQAADDPDEPSEDHLADRSGEQAPGPSRPVVATTSRGLGRRQEIIEAAAAIIRESGPGAVSHRAVARRAGCSLSATTYYFDGLDDLLYQAGQVNIAMWASRAEAVADRVESLDDLPDLHGRIELLLQATLPAEGPYRGHYVQLISAGAAVAVGQAYRNGRQRLNAAVARVLRHLGSTLRPEVVIAIVDGAAVSALSEGRDVRATAADLLGTVVLSTGQVPADRTRSPQPGGIEMNS